MEDDINEETLDIYRAEICVVLFDIISRCPGLAHLISDGLTDNTVHQTLIKLCDYLPENCHSPQKQRLRWTVISEFRKAFQNVPLLKTLYEERVDSENICHMLADISKKTKPGKSPISKRSGESLKDLSKESKRLKLDEQNSTCREEQSSYLDNHEKLSKAANDCSQSNAELAGSPKAPTVSIEHFVKSSKNSVVSNEEAATSRANPVVSAKKLDKTSHGSVASSDHSKDSTQDDTKLYENLNTPNNEQFIKDSNQQIDKSPSCDVCSENNSQSLKDSNTLNLDKLGKSSEIYFSSAYLNKNKLLARSPERNTDFNEQISKCSKESVVSSHELSTVSDTFDAGETLIAFSRKSVETLKTSPIPTCYKEAKLHLDTDSKNPKLSVTDSAGSSGQITTSSKLKSDRDSEIPNLQRELDKTFESKNVSNDTKPESSVMLTAELDMSHVEKEVKKVADDNDVKLQTFEPEDQTETMTKSITDIKVKIINDHQKVTSVNKPVSSCTTLPLLSQNIEDKTSVQLDTIENNIETIPVVDICDSDSEENVCDVPVTVILSDENFTNKGASLDKKKKVTPKGKKLHEGVSEKKIEEKQNKRSREKHAASLPKKEKRKEYQLDEGVNAKCTKVQNQKEMQIKQCCRKQCRQNEFDGNISKLDTQSLKKFVEKSVDVAKCATQSADRGRLRNARRIYTLPDANNENITVCKTFFMETLKISSDFIDCALKNKTSNLLNEKLPDLKNDEKQADNKNDNKTKSKKRSTQINNHSSIDNSTSKVQIATSEKGHNNESQTSDCNNSEESVSIGKIQNNHMGTDAGKDMYYSTSFEESRGITSQTGSTTNSLALQAPNVPLTPMLGPLSEREIGITMSQNSAHVQGIPYTGIPSNTSVYGSPVCNITGITNNINSSVTSTMPNLGIFNQSLNYNYADVTSLCGVSTQNSSKPIAKVAPSPGYISPNSPIPDVHQQDSVIHSHIHPTSNQTTIFDISNQQMPHSAPFTPQRRSETTNQGYLSMLLENMPMDLTYSQYIPLPQVPPQQNPQIPIGTTCSSENLPAQVDQNMEDDNEEMIDIDSAQGNSYKKNVVFWRKK